MINYDEDKIIDVDHIEEVNTLKKDNEESFPNKENGQIELSFYTARQVAEIVEIPYSTLTHWSKVFSKHLERKISNKTRSYTREDVCKLLKIKEYKKQGMTLPQIESYVLEHGWENENGALDTKNPLAIDVFINELTKEMDTKMKNFQKVITKEIMSTMLETQKKMLLAQENTYEKFKEQIALTIDDAITDKLDEFKDDLRASVDELGDNVSNKVEDSLKTASISSETIDSILDTNKNLAKTVEELKNKQLESYEQQERTNDIIARLKLSLEESKLKAQQDEIEKQENKGFFSRLLGR